MTAVGNRPAGVSTLEQEILRVILAFKEANPQTTFREEGDVVSRACTWNMKINDLGELYFVGRVLIPMHALVDGNPIKKPFMRAKEYPQGLSDFPAGYDTL